MADASKALQAKLAAWRRQHAALDAPAYRITLKSRSGKVSFNYGKGRGPDKSERFYSADEVEEILPYLSRQNAQGYDIYITPIDRDFHYLVVDDLHGDALQRMKAEGYQPALVQESSADNQQAILKLRRQDDGKREQSVANALVVEVNRKFGDPKFSGAIHPFRAAGFANKKPGKGTFTKILEDSGILCQHAAARLDEIRADAQQERAPQVTGDPAPTSPAHRHKSTGGSDDREPPVPAPKSDAEQRYAQLVRQWRGLAREKGWREDLSTVDWQACLAMLRDGWDPDVVRECIVAVSPGVSERHSSAERYATTTITEATRFLSRAAAAAGVGVPDEDTDDLSDFLRVSGSPGRGSEPR